MAACADVQLAARYGVAPSVIAALRKELREGEHWTADGCGRVIYTAAGESQLALLLGIEKKEGGAAPVPGPPEDLAAEVVLLSIARVYPSPIWVRVVTPQGAAADVRVRDNRRLQPRMKIECRQTAGRWHCTHLGLAPG